jgi:hypothetical protein
MAVRSPLYYTDSGNLKEMSLIELNDIYAQGKKMNYRQMKIQTYLEIIDIW